MLQAHSLTEARLYLKITGCEKCSPVSSSPQGRVTRPEKSSFAKIERLSGQCPACGAPQELDFAIAINDDAPATGRPPTMNPTEDHSKIIDVGQWLTLSQLFMQESKSEKDKGRARFLNLQAAQCLDEALKFYDDAENDLPPPEAFCCDSSRRRFRKSPQQFSRNRLINEKRKLPVVYDDPTA